MTRQLRVAVLSGLFLLSSLAMVRSAQAQGAPPMTPMPVMDQMTNIPYFTLRDGMSSTLTLQNLAPTPTKVTVTIFNAAGQAHALDPITLDPHSFKEVQLADVAPQGFDSGNIEVMFNGISMVVTCQVSVFSLQERVSFESREQDMMDFESANLAGIVSLPKGADGFLAVTNVAKNRITFQLTAGSLKKTAALFPRETQLIKLNEDELATPTLVKLQHNGLPGDVITTGYVLNMKDGYSSGIAMSDPGIARSSVLAGAHFRAGQPDPSEGFPEGTRFRSPLLLANVGAAPATAHVSVDYTVREKVQMTPINPNDAEPTQDNFKKTVAVKTVTIAPGDVQRVELSDALGGVGEIAEAGVDVAYDAAPGSVIGQLTSVDQSGDYSFEVPIKDPQGMMEMMEGGYPWSLDDGNDTVLHLKNTTNQPATGLLLFDYYDNGIFKTYNYPLISLEPYQTIAIDIRKLRDSKERDVQGHLFAADVTHGQAQWRQEEPYSMIGRAEQTNVKTGIAKSFSCGVYCCDYYLQFEKMSPSSLAGVSGGSGQLGAQRYGISCNGVSFGPFTDSTQNWQSNNTNAATVSSTGLVNYVGAGTGTGLVSANALYFYYQLASGTCSMHQNYTGYVSAPVYANPPTHVHVVFDNNSFLARCPAGVNVMGRNITLQVQDANLRAIPNAPVQERFAVIPTNTCGGGPPAQASCLASDVNGNFNDAQSFNTCTPPFHGCGWTLTDEWQYCPSGVPPINLANMSPEFTYDNQLEMIGIVSPSPIGTTNFRHIGGDIYP